MPEPLPTGRFNHAALNCRDVPRSVAFYRSVLGLQEVARPGFDFNGAWLYREGLGMMLHLIQFQDQQQRGSDPPQLEINTRVNHLAFRVTDVDTAIERLTALGVEFIHKRLPDYGYRQVFFHDPDGNLIEVGEWPDVEQMPMNE